MEMPPLVFDIFLAFWYSKVSTYHTKLKEVKT